MDTKDILLLGLKGRVTAISKKNGREIWSTDLGRGSGPFITMLCEDSRVFAYGHGHLHCLDLASGRLLWTNELPGYGYGLASLCVPGSATDATAAAVAETARKNSD